MEYISIEKVWRVYMDTCACSQREDNKKTIFRLTYKVPITNLFNQAQHQKVKINLATCPRHKETTAKIKPATAQIATMEKSMCRAIQGLVSLKTECRNSYKTTYGNKTNTVAAHHHHLVWASPAPYNPCLYRCYWCKSYPPILATICANGISASKDVLNSSNTCSSHIHSNNIAIIITSIYLYLMTTIITIIWTSTSL